MLEDGASTTDVNFLFERIQLGTFGKWRRQKLRQKNKKPKQHVSKLSWSRRPPMQSLHHARALAQSYCNRHLET